MIGQRQKAAGQEAGCDWSATESSCAAAGPASGLQQGQTDDFRTIIPPHRLAHALKWRPDLPKDPENFSENPYFDRNYAKESGRSKT